jgi:uncharacterized membrane protein
MDSKVYVLIAIVALAVVSLLVFLRRSERHNRLTPLAGLSFAFVIIAGIIFGDERWLGYGLIGIGVVIAVVDMVHRARSRSA